MPTGIKSALSRSREAARGPIQGWHLLRWRPSRSTGGAQCYVKARSRKSVRVPRHETAQIQARSVDVLVDYALLLYPDPMTDNEPLAGLHGRPGFMARRLHQIAVVVFNDHVGRLGVTPAQCGVLYVLKQQPQIDQATLARHMRLDRSTTGTVVGTLESRGLIAREVGQRDRRLRVLALTPDGETMLEQVLRRAAGITDTLLAAFSAEERSLFLTLIRRLIRHFEAEFSTSDRRINQAGTLESAQLVVTTTISSPQPD
jgi:DNA-binding MarR family transcriptional regulator